MSFPKPFSIAFGSLWIDGNNLKIQSPNNLGDLALHLTYIKYFANGVDPQTAKVLYAVQWPTAASIFSGRTTAAAWRSKPSWYAVSKLDYTINPDLERFLAKRMNATTIELDAGHLSLVSHANEIADLILSATGHDK